MEILLVPHPVLRQKANKLKIIQKEDIKIANKMMEVMKKAPGIGLAANQVGILKKIVTINFEDKENNKKANYFLFNPSIIKYSKETIVMEEGCLSLPEQYADVERPKEITIEYMNENSQYIEREVDGYEARILQHEIDHLSGKLFIDYLSSLKRNILIKKVKKFQNFKKKMTKKKIIFMGTPFIAAEHLNILVENNFDIVGVFTKQKKKKNRGMVPQESEVHKVATKNNLKLFHPISINEDYINKTKSLKPDLIIVVAYGIILPLDFLNIPKYGCINVHVSLLPRWRGAAPIEHSLLEGDLKTGISIIKISSKLDAGDILVQDILPIDDSVYSDELTLLLTNLGKTLMIKLLPNIFKKNITLVKQDHNKITYAKKFTSDDRKINFNNSADKVINHIRAHGPKPGSWFIYKGERIKILKAKKIHEKGLKSTILNKNFILGCTEESILPIFIQREGKKAVTLDEFLRGFTFVIGDKLNA